MITLGTDPELFVIKNGVILSAYQALGGDVDVPLPYGTLVPDGAAIEFTVQPSDDPREIVHRIAANIHAAAQYIHSIHPTATLSSISVASVKHLIRSHPVEMGPRCSLQVFGCNPDGCIYEDEWTRPNPIRTPFRSAGGHIHVDINPLTYMKHHAVTALLDATLGLASVILLPTETAKKRKELYGRAGTIRLSRPPILEYRVLPSAMLTASPDVAEWCFKTTQEIVRYVNERSPLEIVLGLGDILPRVQWVINTHNTEGAVELLPLLVKMLPREWFDMPSTVPEGNVYGI